MHSKRALVNFLDFCKVACRLSKKPRTESDGKTDKNDANILMMTFFIQNSPRAAKLIAHTKSNLKFMEKRRSSEIG